MELELRLGDCRLRLGEGSKGEGKRGLGLALGGSRQLDAGRLGLGVRSLNLGLGEVEVGGSWSQVRWLEVWLVALRVGWVLVLGALRVGRVLVLGTLRVGQVLVLGALRVVGVLVLGLGVRQRGLPCLRLWFTGGYSWRRHSICKRKGGKRVSDPSPNPSPRPNPSDHNDKTNTEQEEESAF